ncbi:MAG TPA: hypothetical protein VGZ47_22860 [Gemmataceae bacterium]|nr:hypothetical protein [Gemmataceae bacterium]
MRLLERLTKWIPALAVFLVGIVFKLGGELRGGYGWCDIILVVCVVTAGVLLLQSLANHRDMIRNDGA